MLRNRCFLPLLSALILAAPAWAGVLVNERGDLGPTPQTQRFSFFFDLPAGDTRVAVTFSAQLKTGKGAFRVLDAKGETLCEKGVEQGRSSLNAMLGPFPETGRARAEFSAQESAGEWRAVVVEAPKPQDLAPLRYSGPLMMGVAVLLALWWRLRTRTPGRWFWLGGALWLVAQFLIILRNTWLDPIALNAIKASVSFNAYALLDAIYSSAFTGVLEIGVLVLWGILWRNKLSNARCVLALLVGVITAQAFVQGLGTTIHRSFSFSANAPELQAALYTDTVPRLMATPLLWLAQPVECVLTIGCGLGVCTLALMGIASKRGTYVWRAVLLLTIYHTIPAAFWRSGMVGKVSTWWMVLALVPLAALSLFIASWCWRTWPEAEEAAPQRGK